MLGPAGTGTFGGCDHTAGGRTAFLAHAYAWGQPGTGELAGLRKGTIWKVCGFSIFFFFVFLRSHQNKKVKEGGKTLEIGSDKVND